MRYSAIFLVLVVNAAFVKAAEGDQGDGYTYQINATRVGQTIAPGWPVFYMSSQVQPQQNLTYFMSIDSDNPLSLEAYVANGKTRYFLNEGGDLLNTCGSYDNSTWEYAIVEIVKKAIIPDGGCSVDKGNYMVSSTVAPVTVTFSDMINCGKYMLITSVFVLDDQDKKKWGGQLKFNFEIPDDGNCNKPSR